MPTQVITWPAPAGEAPSADYTVAVNETPVFVYDARVRAEILQHDGLWTHKPDAPGERAAFIIVDLDGPATFTVRPARAFHTATVLPARTGITAAIDGETISFTVDRPGPLTLVLDDSDAIPLHLFIGTPETDVPNPDDPDVIYFGPGMHEIETLALRSGQTLYLAGGAVVKATLRPGEVGTYDEKWKVTQYSGSVLSIDGASKVRICGRGILDGSLVPHPGRSFISLSQARDIHISGIMLRDAANWNVIIGQSEQVQVEDLRIISGRLNSDGINSVNSRDVCIRRCFVRNHDDSFAVKAGAPEPPSEDITVEDCVIWNDWGYAMGPTYETRAPIRRVMYRRCSVLYARHWCMGVRVSDSATISDITFTDIEIAGLAQTSWLGGLHNALTTEPKLFSMIIAADCWGQDPDRGRIRDVTLDNITVYGDHLLASDLSGVDDEHDIRNVTFRNVRLHGQPPVTTVEELRLEQNEFVRGVVVEG